MRLFAPAIGLALGLATAAIAMQVGQNYGDFASLASDERIEVDFESHGCFNNSFHLLDFKPTKEGASVAVDDLGLKRTKKTLWATLTITKEEMKALDKTLAFYRTNKEEGCTSTDLISVKRTSGKLVAEEKFKDSSCVLGFRDLGEHFPEQAKLVKGTMRFQELIHRAMKIFYKDSEPEK